MFDRPLTKGRLAKAENINQYIEFQYNPNAFKDDIGVEWSEIKGAGMSYPIQQYTGGKTRKVSFDLFLNDIEKPGILRKTINFCIALYLLLKARLSISLSSRTCFCFWMVCKISFIRRYANRLSLFFARIRPFNVYS